MAETYTVPEGTRRARVDKLLAAAFREHSRTAWQRALDAGLVSVGGKAVGRDDTLQGGDVVSYAFPATQASTLKPVKIPLDVLFEDKHLLAINKPAGMVVHPGAATGEDTLVHALLAHCKGSLSGVGGIERPGIVHRLDRETSGLILVAKNDKAHRGLAEQFSGRTVQKEYLALVSGVPELLSGSLRKPIGRHPRHRHKMAAFEEGQGGRDAHTDWEVVESFGRIAALVRCTIHTGRTHQIRVHLNEIHHPIAGDPTYGNGTSRRGPEGLVRLFLHAWRVSFTHPRDGRLMRLEAELPPELLAPLDALRLASSRSEG